MMIVVDTINKQSPRGFHFLFFSQIESIALDETHTEREKEHTAMTCQTDSLPQKWNTLCPVEIEELQYEQGLWKCIDEAVHAFQQNAYELHRLLHICSLLHRYMDLGFVLSEENRIRLLNLMLPATLVEGLDYLSRHALLKCMTRILRYVVGIFGPDFS
jgi:hypothetical protein